MKNFKTFLLEDIDSDVLLKRIVADIDELKEKFFRKRPDYLQDLLSDTHYEEFVKWAQRDFTPTQIENEDHLSPSAFEKFAFENEDLVNNWLLKDDDFIDWAEDEVIDDDGREDPMDAYHRMKDMEE